MVYVAEALADLAVWPRSLAVQAQIMKSAIHGFLIALLALLIAPLGKELSAQTNNSGSGVAFVTKTVRGTVKGEDNSLAIVADEDGKSWVVVNPERLRNHHDQHVQIYAELSMDGSLRIISVKQLPPGRFVKTG